MSLSYLLGVDFGGSSSKATLLCENGDVVATAVTEYPTYYPRDGWAEQDPDDSLRAFLQNVRKVLEKSGVSPQQIRAIALDGATHTAVLLDEDDRVIRPAIYWTDRRATAESDELVAQYNDLLMQLSYNAPSPLWTLPQLIWLRRHEQENFKRIHKVLSMKDYVRYRLNGDFVTDSIEAMGFMLLDARTNTWSPQLCALAGLDPEVLPRIVPPHEILSPLYKDICAQTGLSPDTRLLAGATDTVMEVFASGSIAVGQSTVKLATAGRICPITDREYVHPLLVTYRHLVPGLWYPGTATKQCAASFRWYRDTFGAYETAQESALGLDAYRQMDDAAQTVPAGSDNLFFHPYLQGEITPYLDNDLRGSFTGVSSFHTKAHFNRAVLEGVAYSLVECFQVLRSLGIDMQSAAIIGGGAKSPLWRQIVSDMLGIELKKMQRDDSSLGSAMLAGIAAKLFDGYEDCVARCVRVESVVHPDERNHALYQESFKTYKAIHDALAPVYHALAAK
jgi:xylulokinase